METAKHALLGASHSERWLNCTPSARLEATYPDEGSEYAREGSLAHAIAAKKIKERLGLPTFTETAEIKELSEYLSGEMEEYTSDYAYFVLQRYESAKKHTPEGKPTPQIFIEHRIDFSAYVTEGFGTGDVVILAHDAVEIIDFKYGKGIAVNAEKNSQMALYALGIIDMFNYAYDIEKILMTIYQPRVGNISAWITDVDSLLEWGTRIRPLAQLAWEGIGARMSGEWCKFCKAKGDCPRLAADSIAKHILKPNEWTLSLEDRAQLLELLPAIKDWVKTIEERSLELALEGETIPGYKIVEGRSIRKIVNPAKVAEALRGIGASDREIYRPQEIRTLTDLEKIFGKKEFTKLCGAYIEKPAGKPTLVADSDHRKEISNNDFKDLEF